jgi:Glyoxalase-like domain
MLRSHFDHLVVTAPDLAAGVDYISRELGVSPQQGGEHVSMGTHNFLLKLGETAFLEVIAVNPDAPAPKQQRWFELDEPESNESPRLATWIVRTNDIKAALLASPVVSGYVTPMSRGALNWSITVPRNGSLPLQGVAPTIIQWQGAAHPAGTMKDAGCSLIRLEGFHPRAEKVTAMLKAIGFQGDFSVSPLPAGEQPYLVAHIQTPTGLRQLSGNRERTGPALAS